MQAIFLDPDGNVAEGPNMNLGIVTQDDQVVVRAPVQSSAVGIPAQENLQKLKHGFLA